MGSLPTILVYGYLPINNVFLREVDGERILVAINADEQGLHASFNVDAAKKDNLAKIS